MIYLVILELKYLYGAVTPKRYKMVLSVEYKLYWHFVRDSKSWRTFKSLYWFRSYGDFTEWVDFDYWWSCIGKGIPCSLCSRLVSNWESLLFVQQKGFEHTLFDVNSLYVATLCLWNDVKLEKAFIKGVCIREVGYHKVSLFGQTIGLTK